jgi:predicted nuclease of predicted toxin-antitoxin system
MLLCANEHVPGDCVTELRARGHDVLWIRETAPGIADELVLETARSGGRLLITFDKDFGELVFHRGAEASGGIVLFRIRKTSPAEVSHRVAAIIASRSDWKGHFSVIDDYSIRMRPLPKVTN